MAIELSPLPFELNDLSPIISKETLSFHYGKHHQGYVTKANAKIKGTALEKEDLNHIILNSEGGLFNLAAQVWNHEFYWKSMCAPNQKNISEGLLKELEKSFGSLDSFKEKFLKEALTHFGSGWAWLIKNKEGQLQVISTHDAENPLKAGHKPLLTCDVWEHAYYLDYKNDRGSYLEGFWKIVNWDFVDQNLSS